MKRKKLLSLALAAAMLVTTCAPTAFAEEISGTATAETAVTADEAATPIQPETAPTEAEETAAPAPTATSTATPQAAPTPTPAITEAAAEKATLMSAKAQGKCGDNLTWTLDENGVLEISGTGDMSNYRHTSVIESIRYAPWHGYVKKLTLNDGITRVGMDAFWREENLTGSLMIPDSVTYIGNNAFADCSGLTGDLIIPDGVTYIGENAFADCSGLTGDLIIPDGVMYIYSGAFSDCSGFTGTLTIPNSVKGILNGAFAGCSGFTGTLTIPDSVTDIYWWAFSNCSGFTGTLTIPDSVEFIGEKAFYGCSGFTDIVIPVTVKEIEDGTFEGCTSITDVYYGGTASDWKKIAIGSDNEYLTNATIHYTGDATDTVNGEFQIGRDNFSFLNSADDFFTEEEMKKDLEKTIAGQLTNLLHMTSVLKGQSAESQWTCNIQISDASFNKLLAGQSPIVCANLQRKRQALWGGSCRGMATVTALHYNYPERLPLNALDDNLSLDTTVYDLQQPIVSEKVEDLINYYMLSQFCSEQLNSRENASLRIKSNYSEELNKIVSSLKSGIPLVTSLRDSSGKAGGHAVVMVSVKEETDEYYRVSVSDPNINTTLTEMYLYKSAGALEGYINIAYSGAENVNTGNVEYDGGLCYLDAINELDFNNYFEGRTSIAPSPSIRSDYNTSIFKINPRCNVSFVSGDASLIYKDGQIVEQKNMTGPWYYDFGDGDETQEMNFFFEKSLLNDEMTCTVTVPEGEAGEVTLIADDWSAALVSEKTTDVTFNNVEQSVQIKSAEEGLISAMLTQNDPAEEYPWYSTAIDTDNAKELSITPTDKGIDIHSDNLTSAEVAVNNIDETQSKVINETGTELALSQGSSNDGSKILEVGTPSTPATPQPGTTPSATEPPASNNDTNTGNDNTGGNTPAVTGVEGFVDRLYSVCLGREADAAGKADWVGRLTSYQISGTKAAFGFIFSQEFTNMNYSNADFVEHLYAAFMGRASDECGKADWVSKLDAGTSREEVFNGFANSVEFDNICKSYGIVSKDIETFVTRLYSVCLDRQPDENGLADWANQLRSQTISGKAAASGFVFSEEFTNKNYSNADYVEHLYAAFMGRASDEAGKTDWVGKLDAGTNREEVFNGFADSAEFDNICSSYGIVRG